MLLYLKIAYIFSPSSSPVEAQNFGQFILKVVHQRQPNPDKHHCIASVKQAVFTNENILNQRFLHKYFLLSKTGFIKMVSERTLGSLRLADGPARSVFGSSKRL